MICVEIIWNTTAVSSIWRDTVKHSKIEKIWWYSQGQFWKNNSILDKGAMTCQKVQFGDVWRVTTCPYIFYWRLAHTVITKSVADTTFWKDLFIITPTSFFCYTSDTYCNMRLFALFLFVLVGCGVLTHANEGSNLRKVHTNDKRQEMEVGVSNSCSWHFVVLFSLAPGRWWLMRLKQLKLCLSFNGRWKF